MLHLPLWILQSETATTTKNVSKSTIIMIITHTTVRQANQATLLESRTSIGVSAYWMAIM